MPTDTGGMPVAGSPDWVRHGIDPTVPNTARIYDYWLDGAHNFAADREMANRIQQVIRGARDGARINRSFLRTVALFMVESGIRQFLDIGSGIPTVGNVHEIAQGAEPECRVVYVDKEPVTHSELLLAGNDRAAAIRRTSATSRTSSDDPALRTDRGPGVLPQPRGATQLVHRL